MSDGPNVISRSRNLKNFGLKWTHNAWDNICWDREKIGRAEAQVQEQTLASPHLSSPQAGLKHELALASHWNTFYARHNRWFFKDRKWLESEFPELFAEGAVVFEVGCGVGNTVYPILLGRKRRKENTKGIMVHACDFSPEAVRLAREHRDYDPTAVHVFQHDLVSDAPFEGIAEGSLDAVIAIFVLSALHPSQHVGVVSRLASLLKKGGILIFRDYGRYDMAQLRFKAEQLVERQLYLRGDGTLVYFFEEEEVSRVMEQAGLAAVRCETDRRLVLNRLRRLEMYRVWIQGRFAK